MDVFCRCASTVHIHTHPPRFDFQARLSWSLNYWYFGSVNSLFWGWPVCRGMFGSIPGITRSRYHFSSPLTYTPSFPRQPQMFPNVAKCLLGDKISLGWKGLASDWDGKLQRGGREDREWGTWGFSLGCRDVVSRLFLFMEITKDAYKCF